MREMLTRWAMLAAAVLGIMVGPAEAAMMIYTETVTGSGTLGGVAFTNATVIFTQAADTANIVQFPVTSYVLPAAVATVQVVGLGSGTFSVPTALQAVGSTGEIGFYQGALMGGTTILDQHIPTLLGYNLSTATGPATGSGIVVYDPSNLLATTAGGMKLTSVSSNVTFNAAAASVPEPSSLALTAAGLVSVGLAGWRCVRRRTTN